MSKVALLIGVSEYLPDLKPLPAAVQDVEAIQAILQNPEIGHFDEVKTLINPVPMEMQEAIEALFTGRAKDDLVLLFFSGHGIKDDNGRLFFATRSTRKHPNGELVKATTVPASFVHDVMNYSRSKRQVVVLDCCFGGAFAEGLAAKDDGSIDVRSQLGGEGRAILTSSASTQYSFEQASDRLSIYTRYLVEGIETGLADLDNDGMISVDELHEYASGKVREVTTSMKPEIYAVKEGFKIHLVHAPVSDPQSRYRKEVERFAQQGEISEIARTALEVQREKLGLSYREATLIEAEVIEPYREHRHKLQRYRQVFDEAIRREFPLSDRTRNELKLLQQTLNLIEEDIALIESQGLLSQAQTITPAQSQQINKEEGQKLAKHFKYKFHFLLIIGTIAILIFGLTTYSKTTVFSSLLGWINSYLYENKKEKEIHNKIINFKEIGDYKQCIETARTLSNISEPIIQNVVMECHENELLEQIRKLVREDKFEQANKVLTSFQLTKFKQEAEKIIIQKCKWYLDEYTKIPRNPAIFLKVGDRSNENTEIRNECSEVGIDIPE